MLLGTLLQRSLLRSALLLAAIGSAAHADPRTFNGESSDYVSNGRFGLGLELGEPSGLNGKLFVSSSHAIDFGIGDLYRNYYVDGGEGLHVYADYLWHPVQLVRTDAFKLPFYIGIGGRVWSFDYDCKGCADNGAALAGIRVPIGVTFDFNHVPIDIFAQLVPTLDFFHNYVDHSVYLDVDFSIGARYWF